MPQGSDHPPLKNPTRKPLHHGPFARDRTRGNNLFVCIFLFFRDRIYALQRQKERLEEQVDLANKALAESAAKPKK